MLLLQADSSDAVAVLSVHEAIYHAEGAKDHKQAYMYSMQYLKGGKWLQNPVTITTRGVHRTLFSFVGYQSIKLLAHLTLPRAPRPYFIVWVRSQWRVEWA